MDEENVMLETVRSEGEHWLVEISFRGKRYSMTFKPDHAGRLRPVGNSPFAVTLEGWEICRQVERARSGEALALPHRVEPGEDAPRRISVHSALWSDGPRLQEAWLESAERSGDARWVAQLRLDGNVEMYEVEILPGLVVSELRGPKAPSFRSFEYDLIRLLLRMHAGERFALPFKLRPRWPTPPDPPSLPPS
jgi:hypothetical protein